MSLYISSLNSGSNGNCYYVGNDKDAVLIDAGISCREIEKRMAYAGLLIDKVKAVFISHEHSDHIKGVQVFSRKYKIPVYITPATLQSGGLRLEEELTLSFSAYQKIHVGNLMVTAFPKWHDASDPHSFIISDAGVTVGVFTDIGAPCEDVIKNFRKCNAVFLESNYDETMLEEGNYPIYLKQRIQSDKGHLSNNQALQLFKEHGSPFLSHILLSHLSKDNNSPELTKKLFDSHANKTIVTVASRDYASDVYKISLNGTQEVQSRNKEKENSMRLGISNQTKLF